MSVIACYLRAPDSFWGELRTDPSVIEQVYSGAVPDAEIVDFDKAWEAAAWLLSDQKRRATEIESEGNDDDSVLPDLAWGVIEGTLGTEVPEADYGYGPSSLIDPTTVQAASTLFSSITDEYLATRYDPVAMDALAIYPESWVDDPEEQFEYVRGNFGIVRDFFQRAALGRQQVLMFYS